MKRLILIAMLLLPLSVMAQQDRFSVLVEKYSTQQGCTTIEMSSYMIRSMGVKAGIDYMQIVSVENASLFADFREDIEGVVEDMSVLMSVNNGSDKVKIYNTCGDKGCVTHLVVITEDGEAIVLVYLRGSDIQLKDVDSLINLQ